MAPERDSDEMRWAWLRAAVAALLCLGAVACSSSGGDDVSASETGVSAAPSGDATQAYLDAVNRLCDALLPKIVEVTGGGSFDIPLKEFFAQLPAHQRLRDGFDRDLARVPVPPSAADEASALAAYVRFANDLDERRLAAARNGATAYAKEIAAESDAIHDPTVAALSAAGFHESCTAR